MRRCRFIISAAILMSSMVVFGYSFCFAEEEITQLPVADEVVSYALEKPVIKAKNMESSGKIKLSWKKVKLADTYEIYRASSETGRYKKIGISMTNEYIDRDAVRKKTYYYKVRATEGSDEISDSLFSNVIYRTCDLPQTTISVRNDAESGKPKLTWKKVKQADKYRVYYATSKNGTYKRAITTSKNSFTHNDAIPGKCYYYKVQPISIDKAAANGALSEWKKRVCDMRKPVCQITLSQKGKPKLTWKTVKGADCYQIYRATKKNGTYKRIATVEKNSFINTKALYHRTYYYKVMAIDKEQEYAASAKSKMISVYTIDLRKKLVALTFDDGPGPYTKKIVNCLKKNNGHATFYVLGQRVKSYPSTLKAIHAGGNEIGNHSYSHPLLSDMNGKQIRSQVRRTDNAVKKITGQVPATIRPPYGGIDNLVSKNVGKPMILWSIDTLDWEHRNAKTTVNHVMRNVSDGDIVLMHDIHEPTMRAALELIPKLKKKGYELVTVSELAKYRGVKMKNGKRYYNF